jgi:hypothetical protein
MNNKLTIFCLLILCMICMYVGCSWEKGHRPPTKTIPGKTDTVTVQLPPVTTVIDHFTTKIVSKTDTIYRNLVTLDSTACNTVNSSTLTSTDSLVSVDLVYRGELLTSSIRQREFQKYIIRTDTVVKKINKTFGINAGFFIQRDLRYSGGAMLSIQIKGYQLGVMANPFLNSTSAFFTVPIK